MWKQVEDRHYEKLEGKAALNTSPNGKSRFEMLIGTQLLLGILTRNWPRPLVAQGSTA